MMDILPYCFFPTTVVSISPDSLQDESCRPNTCGAYKWLNVREDSFKISELHLEPSVLTHRFNSNYRYPWDEEFIFYLYEEIYNPQRYETISCILLEGNIGILHKSEFSEYLNAYPISRVLFNSPLDVSRTLKIFNMGLIDYYIEHDYCQDLTLLRKAQESYFIKLVNHYVDPILKKWQALTAQTPALFDPLFLKFFKEFISNQNIQEYYLLDLMGSFLMIDTEGNFSVLHTFNERTFLENEQELQRLGVPQGKLSLLKSQGQTICLPFIYSQTDIPVERNVTSVQTLNGSERYYVAHAQSIDYLDYREIKSMGRCENHFKKEELSIYEAS